MIVSASRRTDIPAQHMPWLMQRLHEGYVLVRNPVSPRRVSRVPLTKDVLDGMVFWSKNPLPILPHLEQLRDIPFYIQFTLTPYGRDIEQNLPEKRALLDGFVQLSHILGPQRMVWRYDPILLNAQWTADVHLASFRAMAKRLAGCTDTCVVSFLDPYRSMAARCALLHLQYPSTDQMQELFSRLSAAANDCGMHLCTCCEQLPDAPRSACIDKARLERILGTPLKLSPDKNQRSGCGCFESVDIGAYDTCQNGCLYCYATHRPVIALPPPDSPILGTLHPDDIVTDRKVVSQKILQTSLF